MRKWGPGPNLTHTACLGWSRTPTPNQGAYLAPTRAGLRYCASEGLRSAGAPGGREATLSTVGAAQGLRGPLPGA